MDRSEIAQKHLEQEMLERGVARYAKAQDKAHERHEITSAENRLFKEVIGKVEQAIQEGLGKAESAKGKKPEWYEPANTAGALHCAVAALRIAFGAAVERTSYTKTCVHIGRQIELEMISRIVEAKDVELYKKILKRATNAAGLFTLQARQQNFLESVSDAGFWSPLGEDDLLKIGAGIFNFVLSSTSLFNVELTELDVMKDQLEVTFTEETNTKLSQISEMEAWMKPVYRPMVIPPRPWENVHTGCYLEPKVSRTVPMVKTFSKDHLKLVDAAVKSDAPFVSALNAIQAVPLRINEFVLEHLIEAYESGKEVPGFPEPLIDIKDLKNKEKLSKSKEMALKKANIELAANQANFDRDLSEAIEYAKYDRFYQPAQFDWRSRVYCKNHLNHQRSDYCKALFEFADGKPLGEHGWKWLAIHLASSGAFEKMDKAPMQDRINWTAKHTQRIMEMVEDPQADLWWTEADSPFLFLACCKAWADYMEQGADYICHLPVNQDGSCSGLQHFSAMLRDPVGGAAVSLVPAAKPADVYQKVADIVLAKALDDAAHGTLKETKEVMIKEEDGTKKKVKVEVEGTMVHAKRWLEFGIDRKVAKRCVMTFVYGSKQFGFAEHIEDDFMKKYSIAVKAKKIDVHPFGEDEGRGASQYMAKLVWDAVQKVVQAAAEGMDWLQEVAGLLASENKPVMWTTPVGFPVVNAYYKPATTRVKLMLWDREMSVPVRVEPKVTTGMTDELMGRKQRSSISPNFVHSMDSSHLMSIVLKAKQEGINDFLMIHDSFGCLPSDMERFSQIIRETFVTMYEHHDPLKDLYESAFLQLSEKGRKKLKPPPAKGSLDLQGVLDSLYAFA